MKKIKLAKINLALIVVIATPVLIAAMVFFRYLPRIQFMILTLAAIIYVKVAILHHLKEKTLKLEIVIEYVLIAALALIILQNLLT